ncbi:UNVERIFIED_CONTAM: hypothetical protein GTU68_014652 [Idotea baltica]|nr:hypothetical protein [Idotea baltica]
MAQLNYHIGNFEQNLAKMKMAIQEAKVKQADIIVFGELATCGYPPRDFLEFKDFIELSNHSIDTLAALSQDIAIVVGAPSINPIPEGKDLYNSAYFLHDGKVQQVVHKTLLPTYDIFDEYRYFEVNQEFKVVSFKGRKIAITVCEDIWNIGNENPLYRICPMDELMDQSPDFMINLSASPFDFKHAQDRLDIVEANAKRYQLPIFYCNHVGAQTEVIFDGGSIVMDADAKLVDEMPYFEECQRYYDLSKIATNEKESFWSAQNKDKYDLIERALICGVKDYFGKLGFRKAILGLSGGIDSALTLYIAAKALGPENVLSVLMPSQYSSDHSINDSLKLVKNLGSPHKIVAIENMFNQYIADLNEHFEGKDANVTEENIQARIRGNILMALSNKHGYIVLNTSNKSESAVGYGTLYGDMCGGLSVIGDLYKIEVFDLCQHINRNGEIIPDHILTKPPSAELRPDQKDSDSLPEYDVLDPILFHYIEGRKGPQEIIAMGYDAALVKRILRLVNMSEYKRYQTAPMLRVSAKAFGMGRRMPIVGKYLS